jgi:hypothetical protein
MLATATGAECRGALPLAAAWEWVSNLLLISSNSLFPLGCVLAVRNVSVKGYLFMVIVQVL